MKISKLQFITFLLVISIITLLIIPGALAKPRKTYLTEYLYDCEIKDEGFSNSAENDDNINAQATAYALEILDYFDLLVKKNLIGEVEKTVNSTDLTEELEDNVIGKIDSGAPDLYDLYYLIHALSILEDSNEDFSISSSLKDKSKTYLDSLLRNNGGYAPLKSSEVATIASTYYALAIYDLIDRAYVNETSTKNWVRTCQNGDGGFGGHNGLSSTIANTYYAILIMDLIAEVDDIDEDDAIEFLKSFYEDNENKIEKYGGYYPDDNSKYPLISSTFYCIIGIYIIDDGELDNEDETLQWILNRQNFKDGAFVDMSDGSQQKFSSVINSYFAFKVLTILDKDQVSWNEEIFKVEFNWWILIVLLVGIGATAIAIIVIWRKRRI